MYVIYAFLGLSISLQWKQPTAPSKKQTNTQFTRGVEGKFFKGGGQSHFSRCDFSLFPVEISILVDPEKVSSVFSKK